MVLTSDYQFIGRTTGVKARADSWYYYVLLYAKTTGSIATGKHTVSVLMRLVCDRNSSFFGFGTSGSVTVAGASAISWTNQNKPSAEWPTTSITEGGITYPRWVDLAEGSVEVNTGYGAAKDVVISASWQRLASSTTPPSYVPGTTAIAADITVTLPMIAGASTPTLSASTVEMEQPVTIYTNRLSAGFTHTLIGAFGGARELIAENVGDSCAWYPPVELARQIPGHTLGQGHIECYTYQNGVQIGSAQLVRIYLTVPASVVPTATMQWSDASGAMDRFGTLVQNVSRLAVQISGTGAYGSTIKSAAAYLDGAAYSGGVLTKSGAQTLRGTVTDSRGRSGSKSSTITVAAYAVPTVKVQASRCLEDGTADDTGEFALVTITGSTTQVNGKNTAALTFKHGNTTKGIPVEVGDFTHEEIVEAPSVSTLALSATLSDAILTATDNMTLSVGYATMDFLKGGKGIAFGATATAEGFTCAMDAEFLGKVKGTIFDAIYPVGSIYMSASSTDPAALFGGTWERIQDRFLLAAGSYAPGSVGGEASHTLTESELPSHIHDGITTAALENSHRMLYATAAAHATGQSAYWSLQSGTAAGNMTARTVPSGGGQPHNNLPPYLAVHIWKRTA